MSTPKSTPKKLSEQLLVRVFIPEINAQVWLSVYD